MWILICVLGLGWGGNDVKFQEFSSEAHCRAALASTVKDLKAYGAGKGWALECVEK
jgi:hypothetical protein